MAVEPGLPAGRFARYKILTKYLIIGSEEKAQACFSFFPSEPIIS